MIRVRLIYGHDLYELESGVNSFLKLCNESHYVVRHITFNTSRSDISPSAFVEYESFEEKYDTCEEEE